MARPLAIQTLVVAMWFLSVGSNWAGTSIDLKTEQIARIKVKAGSVLEKLKQSCDSLHLRYLGADRFSPKWGCFDEDASFPGPKWLTVRLDGEKQSFKYRCQTDTLLDYSNSNYDDLEEINKFSFPPDKPAWTKAKAISIATEFKQVLSPTGNFTLGLPTAEYEHSTYDKDGKAARHGRWSVFWPRTDAEGHPFWQDHITITFYEGYGLYGAAVMLDSCYSPAVGKRMDIGAAVNKAREALEIKKVDRQFESYADGDQLLDYKLIKAEMLVASPMIMGRLDTGFADRPARLTWEIWFQPRHSKKAMHSLYDDSFAVWIDAYNGEILGQYGWL